MTSSNLSMRTYAAAIIFSVAGIYSKCTVLYMQHILKTNYSVLCSVVFTFFEPLKVLCVFYLSVLSSVVTHVCKFVLCRCIVYMYAIQLVLGPRPIINYLTVQFTLKYLTYVTDCKIKYILYLFYFIYNKTNRPSRAVEYGPADLSLG